MSSFQGEFSVALGGLKIRVESSLELPEGPKDAEVEEILVSSGAAVGSGASEKSALSVGGSKRSTLFSEVGISSDSSSIRG